MNCFRFRRRALALALTLPLGLGPCLVSAQNNLPNLGDTVREALSPQLERKLGDEIMRDILRDPDFVDDPMVLEYLGNFGNQLLSAYPGARGEANYEYTFFAVRDPVLNAFALPGGNIAVHTGLMLAAQTESELAAVMAHEIGHVAQRHIARGIGQQKQDSLIPLGSALLAILAARSGSSSNTDAALALLQGGQGLVLQRQLNFSRDLEREADRVGFQILKEANFDTSGMVAFFGRMQTASRGYNDNVPAFLLSHPLTTERMADIQGRVREQRYKQRADSLDFQLIQSRVRILQNPGAQGLQETAQYFENQLLQHQTGQVLAGKYGLALVALKQGQFDVAQKWLQQVKDQAPAKQGILVLAYSSLELKLARAGSQDAISPRTNPDQARLALAEARAAHGQFPASRGIARQLGDALLASGKLEEAGSYLRDQILLYRQDAKLHEQLAKVYATQGKLALQHLALAESYVLQGAVPAALDQLGLARRAGDATFYDLAILDARERELQARRKEELKDSKNKQPGQ